ncbi:beta carbonic anhydrase 5, chloroplastic-like isoform X4 [Camellia sinensis]|uniref:beta carbonic anhydrase 5, chloroplastic-like isoform X4 n=1 Tax=Camellia sinensis TaxID=4442 RepID=UPI00103556AA|nr:beta carbonic anhydrase 5, chloroplastic-like isoform X4 [Camellia sinensis]
MKLILKFWKIKKYINSIYFERKFSLFSLSLNTFNHNWPLIAINYHRLAFDKFRQASATFEWASAIKQLPYVTNSPSMATTTITTTSVNSSLLTTIFASPSTQIFGTQLKLVEIEQTHLSLPISFKSNSVLRLKASMEPPGLTQELTNSKQESIIGTRNGSDLFNEMKHRFLSFKRQKFLENLECYENLAKSQAPKFMVIACADSRVCPSYILGFQPGEAFVVRNVANLVPPFEVENILVIGHSCCGGIRALMSMQDDVNSSSFIRSWVVVGKNARLSTKAVASNLSFDQQCRHCEKESINRSLMSLLTYPWIHERVTKGKLSIHGGYYNFVDCTFEKWTLDYEQSSLREESGKYSLKNREFWS